MFAALGTMFGLNGSIEMYKINIFKSHGKFFSVSNPVTEIFLEDQNSACLFCECGPLVRLFHPQG